MSASELSSMPRHQRLWGWVAAQGGRAGRCEVQRLPVECIELLRYLHDHDDTAFGLL
ncbi:hypothetical protein WEI85_37610 [Actinomycetes bacterium KLBMP 9797]